MRELPLIKPMSVADIGVVLSETLKQKDPIDRMLEFTMANERFTRYDFFVLKVMYHHVTVGCLFTTTTRNILLKDILAVADARVSRRDEVFKGRIREHFYIIKDHNNL
jgi:uncharacterized protein (UPF0218 family)